MIGLTRVRQTALNHVAFDRERNSAHFYPDPQDDDVSTVEMVLDCRSPGSFTSSDTPTETEITDVPTEDEDSSSDAMTTDHDRRYPPFATSVLDTSRDPLTGLIDLCDEVDRFDLYCSEFETPLHQLYDIVSHYLSHLNTYTTPILRCFISTIPNHNLSPCRQTLLFLLLQGAVDTMDSIQGHYEGRRNRRWKDSVNSLLNLLFRQMVEIREATDQCINLGFTYE